MAITKNSLVKVSTNTIPAESLTGMTLEFDVVTGDKITIPTRDGYDYNYYINWGDGSPMHKITSFDDPNRSHVYHSTGTIQVSFSGTMESITTMMVNDNPLPSAYTTFANRLKKVVTWGATPQLIVFNFAYCSNLTHLPNEVGKLSLVVDFYKTFMGTKLTSIPVGLLDNPNATHFGSIFLNVNTLTTITDRVFRYTPKLTDAVWIFGSINGLGGGITSLPVDLFKYTPLLKDLEYAFSNSQISAIPSRFFEHNPNLENVGALFRSTKLTATQSDLFQYSKKLTNVSGIFANCELLVSVDNNLFASQPHLLYANSVFSHCPALYYVGSNLLGNCPALEYCSFMFASDAHIPSMPYHVVTNLNTNIIDMTGMFYECTGMGGNAENYWDYSSFYSNSHGSCFYGCTNLTNYSTIPTDWK